MLDAYQGRTVLISGAGEGIGRSLALGFAQAGLSVGLIDIDEKLLERTLVEIEGHGVRAAGARCDVSIESEVRTATQELVDALGAPAILWANAGVGSMGGVLGMETRNLDWLYQVNVIGMLHFLRAGAEHLMRNQGERHIGITASVSGLTAIGAYAAAYGATKFAVIGIGEALRSELAESGIGVTICCPGLVNTRIWDAGKARPERFGGETHLPEEIGERWRQHGMTPDWVAEVTLEQVNAGGGYVSPVDPHSLDDFDSRAEEVRKSFRFKPEAT